MPALHAALHDVDAQFGQPLVIHARAPAFLFRQVRMMVGALVEVGGAATLRRGTARAESARDRSAADECHSTRCWACATALRPRM